MSTDYRVFWVLGIFEFGIGDIGTTIIGLSRGYTEAHPVSGLIIEQAGIYGMISVKLFVLVLLYGLYLVSPDEWKRGVPIGLFVIGMAIVIWNMVSIHLWTVFEQLSRTLVAATDLLFT